ncbi:hypothetical protein GCM10025783_02210 [Amnibacterium soli]|uniref:Uncharacterized protein n=2 Tax=Amnibacterium soli TaxID=1282736 RepID=A0ABP8YQC3_9MICO
MRMTAGLLVPHRRRPTIGALYVGAVAAFAVLMLVLVAAGLVQPLAVAVVAVPLGPIGVLAAAFALPALQGPPSLALGAIVLAAVLAVAAVNVLLAAALARVSARRTAADLVR